MICKYNDKDDNGGDNVEKIIYMETAPFDFYLEEKMKLIEYTNLLRTVSWIS